MTFFVLEGVGCNALKLGTILSRFGACRVEIGAIIALS